MLKTPEQVPPDSPRNGTPPVPSPYSFFHKICQDQPHKEAVDSPAQGPSGTHRKRRGHKCCRRGGYKLLASSIENAAEKIFLKDRGCRQKHHSLQPQISCEQALICQGRARDLKRSPTRPNARDIPAPLKNAAAAIFPFQCSFP